ncbi:MAG TPA: L-histidine N(alpha)-methyltransferase [Acidimicrobiales bacterium]|nr:L-histidine N(alpha)-methyltransferase [Acidimicrobiales bacterium]
MCRFLAYLGPPVSLDSLLFAREHSLVHQSYAPRHQEHGRVNADGFGVGWYDRSVRQEPARYRSDRPIWSDRSLASLAPLVRSPAVVAAVRGATSPAAVEVSGSPPFTSGPWLFAHNGAVVGFDGSAGVDLRRRITPRRQAGIEGASDSEVLFALVLDVLDAGADLATALAQVVRLVTSVAPARLNLVLTDGVEMAATAWGDTLFVLDAGGDAGGVVVASEPWDDDARWVRVPEGSVVGCDGDHVRISDLGVPPGHADGRPSSRSRGTVRVDVHLQGDDLVDALCGDVRRGLLSEPKWLSPKWFYDDHGSMLFDAITRLPEYYPTRRETEILERRAYDIATACPADTLVELGSGTSTKTRLLLDALAGAGSLTRVVPFDVSEATLRTAADELASSYPGIDVHAVVGDFQRHLRHLPGGGRRLVALLGGTIGNLDPSERAQFLAEVSASLAPGDGLLLGTDLVKDPARLVAAYDDPGGVTARFNANVFSVLNRELGADFDVSAFAHVARWDPEREHIEMRLRSLVGQSAWLPAIELHVDFAPDEELRTEISTKFRREGVEAEVAAAGLRLAHWWTDRRGDFALSLSFPR